VVNVARALGVQSVYENQAVLANGNSQHMKIICNAQKPAIVLEYIRKLTDPIRCYHRIDSEFQPNWGISVKPSTKAALALNALIELGKRRPAKPLALSVLAEQQSISLSYLEQVFAALRRAGLVVSVRGPGGGYLLAKPAQDITAGDVLAAVDNDMTARHGGTHLTGDGEPLSVSETFWAYITRRVSGIYQEVSLTDIVEGRLRSEVREQDLEPLAAE
jgi:Rrf2 family iron-sulfur cluster assembly transcriptional regulator